MRLHASRKNSVLWHRLSVSGFILAVVVSLMGAALLSQKPLVAQQKRESRTLASSKGNEAVPTAVFQGVGAGVPGGVSGGLESAVAAGVSGGVRAKQHTQGPRQ